MNNQRWKNLKIVSGGQTGVDRAALDVALYLGIDHGGWCPLGRRSECGAIPEIYQLKETDSRDYAVRTEKNVIESDGTLILYSAVLRGGTALTYRLCEQHCRPSLLVDLVEFDDSISQEHESVQTVLDWIELSNLSVINVAGPRASSVDGIGNSATAFLLQVFRRN